MYELSHPGTPLKGHIELTGSKSIAGPAGTTFRFLTGFLSRRPGYQVLTGSQRMKERPIGILVDALRELGADIEYTENEGYPPLRIGHSALDRTSALTIAADTSSQYISCLLMLAPTLPKGLRLTLAGNIVSVPYIKMTLSLMAYFGVKSSWEGQTIVVEPQAYRPLCGERPGGRRRSRTLSTLWGRYRLQCSRAAHHETRRHRRTCLLRARLCRLS